jgi:hypothetical protein
MKINCGRVNFGHREEAISLGDPKRTTQDKAIVTEYELALRITYKTYRLGSTRI